MGYSRYKKQQQQRRQRQRSTTPPRNTRSAAHTSTLPEAAAAHPKEALEPSALPSHPQLPAASATLQTPLQAPPHEVRSPCASEPLSPYGTTPLLFRGGAGSATGLESDAAGKQDGLTAAAVPAAAGAGGVGSAGEPNSEAAAKHEGSGGSGSKENRSVNGVNDGGAASDNSKAAACTPGLVAGAAGEGLNAGEGS
eukprot:scaffold6077_cov18-Tisochrysis_lutea.AAC.1